MTQLKRARPTFVSPLAHHDTSSDPKRPQLTPPNGADNRVEEPRVEELAKEKTLLESRLKEREGKLSKLKLVKLYRSKVSPLPNH